MSCGRMANTIHLMGELEPKSLDLFTQIVQQRNTRMILWEAGCDYYYWIEFPQALTLKWDYRPEYDTNIMFLGIIHHPIFI
jgi:hypothetical protein